MLRYSPFLCLPPMIHRPLNHSIVQTTKIFKATVQCYRCRCRHAAEAWLCNKKEFLKRNISKTLPNRLAKGSPWENIDLIALSKNLQATFWEITKWLETVSLKRTVQFIATLTKEESKGASTPLKIQLGRGRSPPDQIISITGSPLPSCGQTSLLQLLSRSLCRQQHRADATNRMQKHCWPSLCSL